MAMITGVGAVTAKVNIDAAAMTNGATAKAVVLMRSLHPTRKWSSGQGVAASVVKAMVALTGAIMIVRTPYRFRSRHNQACAKAVVASVRAVVARAVVTASLHLRAHRWQRSQPRRHLVRLVLYGQNGLRPRLVGIVWSKLTTGKVLNKESGRAGGRGTAAKRAGPEIVGANGDD